MVFPFIRVSQMMNNKEHQKKRNLFAAFAIFVAAGATVGICGLVLSLANTVGGAPTPITAIEEDLPQEKPIPVLDPGGNTLSASVTSPASLPLSSVLGTHSAAVARVAVSEIGTDASTLHVVTGGQDNTVRVWSANEETASVESKLLLHSSQVNALAPIAPKTETQSIRLATGSGSGELKLWDVDAGSLITTIADDGGRILSMAASKEGTFVASGSSEGALKVWPVEAIANQKSQTNLRGRALKSSGPDITALAYHPVDSKQLISGDADGTIQVWDTEQARVSLTIAGTAAAEADPSISALAISPDGRYLASASDRFIYVWNLQTGRLTQKLAGHGQIVTDLAFSADGQVLASSGYNQVVKTWNWMEADVLCTLSDEAGAVFSVAFAKEGKALITGSEDGTVRAWDLSKDSNRACVGQS